MSLADSDGEVKQTRGRLASLDAFRGLTIAGMILVNNPGSWGDIYTPLDHAEWHGWTPTDLIFPFFLFIVGAAIPFSRTHQAEPRAFYTRVLRRALLLFACGLFLHLFPGFDFAHLRIPGVLQRIALCYCAAALIAFRGGEKASAVCAGAILIGYWLLLTFVPAPGHAAGDLTREGNLPAWLDRAVFGPDHIWKKDFDPEGLLSTLPAIATTLLGVLTGLRLKERRPPAETAAGLFTAGCLLAVAGTLWSAVFPVNKSLWTSSYVLLTGGMALLFLGFCYWTIDGLGWRSWAKPFEIYGLNAIAAFMLSGILARILIAVHVTSADGKLVSLRSWLYHALFLPWLHGKNASLAFALANVLFWLGAVTLLYRKRIFIKL